MPTYPSFPEVAHRSFMWHDEATILTGNALLPLLNTSQVFAGYALQNVSANGDSFTHQFFVKAGTYTLYVLGLTANNCPIVDWYVDGVLIGAGQDWYTSGIVYNVIKTIAGIAITDGKHVLKGVINGRNASNTLAYNLDLSAYWLQQGSD